MASGRQLTTWQLRAALLSGLAAFAVGVLYRPLSPAAASLAIAGAMASAWLSGQTSHRRLIGFVPLILFMVFATRIIATDPGMFAQWLGLQTFLACAWLLKRRGHKRISQGDQQ